MIIVALWALLLAFLVYGALLLYRLKREDPSLWPDVELPAAGACFRIHPAWLAGRVRESLHVRTGIPGGELLVEALPAKDGPADRGRAPSATVRLAEIVAGSRVSLDAVSIEPFVTGAARGARLASAGTTPEGDRVYFEFHLLEGTKRDVLFRYLCPVLSGSLEALPLQRAVESLEFSGLGADETRRGSGQ